MSNTKFKCLLFLWVAFLGCTDIPDELREEAKNGGAAKCNGITYIEYQFCADGRVYDFCDGTPYNPSLVDCCNNHQYTISTEFCSGLAIYRKCGDSKYYPETEFCLNDRIYSKCGNSSYNPATQFCSDSKIYSKCDGSEYDTETQGCLSDVIQDKCGIYLYNSVTQFCSDNVVYSLCGGSKYDTKWERCQSGVIQDKCGTSWYNSATEFCSDDRVYSKCGGSSYDYPEEKFCSNGKVYSKCGNSSYNPETQFCSWWDSRVYSLCGGLVYDTERQRCQSGVVQGKCGTNWYNVSTQFCYGDGVYSLCGGSSYTPKDEYGRCQNGVVQGKCGTSWYDPTTQFCSYGTLENYVFVTDSRDNKTYKIVVINNQTWMAENLNYDADGSKCYENQEGNCQKYGRLYNWQTAKSACPSGWHLPSNVEWTTLTDFVDNQGTRLKSISDWISPMNGNTDGQPDVGRQDNYGFSALPGGYYSNVFRYVGNSGYWWSASEYDSNNAIFGRISYYGAVYRDEFFYSYIDKNDLLSVRCIKD